MSDGLPPKVGDLDVLEVECGARGSGKSTEMVVRTHEILRACGGGYVIGHSLGQRIPRQLPPGIYGGQPTPLVYHRSVGEMSRGLATSPSSWHIVAPPMLDEDPRPDLPRSTADDVIRAAIRLSYRLRRAAWDAANPLRSLFTSSAKLLDFTGLRVPPIILLIDEGTAVSGAAGGDRGKAEGADAWNQFMISLRHLNIAMFFCTQGATMRSYKIMEQATLINAYQTVHQFALTNLRAAGATEAQLAQLPNLDLYESIQIVPIARKRRDLGPPPKLAAVEPPPDDAA